MTLANVYWCWGPGNFYWATYVQICLTTAAGSPYQKTTTAGTILKEQSRRDHK